MPTLSEIRETYVDNADYRASDSVAKAERFATSIRQLTPRPARFRSP